MSARLWLTLGGLSALALVLVWSHTSAYQRGKTDERAATLSRSVEILRERSRTDEEIRALDTAGLCRALGGQWLPDDGTCQ